MPNSVMGSYWWRCPKNPDSEFRVLSVCAISPLNPGTTRPESPGKAALQEAVGKMDFMGSDSESE